MGIKKYINTTKEQDRDGASPLVSLNEIINLIKSFGKYGCGFMGHCDLCDRIPREELLKELQEDSPKP